MAPVMDPSQFPVTYGRLCRHEMEMHNFLLKSRHLTDEVLDPVSKLVVGS